LVTDPWLRDWPEEYSLGHRPVFEAVPVEDFTAEFLDAQCAESLWPAAAFTSLAECVEACLNFQTDPAPVSNLCG
jgi:hypothetical protein